MRERHAPQCFNPDDFGSHGCRHEAIANAYEDHINGSPSDAALLAFLGDDEDTIDFINDTAHVTNSVLTTDLNLPDAPTLREALAGAERDEWHAAILEELAAICEAGTWELVDPNPSIQNVIGCRFVLQKKRGASGEVTRFKA